MIIIIKFSLLDSIILDCGKSNKLCPGSQTVTLKCDTGNNYLAWGNDDFEVEFHGGDDVNDSECNSNFCGELIQKKPTFKSTLVFESSLVAEGSLVYCKHLIDQTVHKSCAISHMGEYDCYAILMQTCC